MSFMGLPLELRSMIYAELQPRASLTSVTSSTLSWRTPSLLLTSKQIRQEILVAWKSTWPPLPQIDISHACDIEDVRESSEGSTTWLARWCAHASCEYTEKITRIELLGRYWQDSKIVAIDRWPYEETLDWRTCVAAEIEYAFNCLLRCFPALKVIQVVAKAWPAEMWREPMMRVVKEHGSIEEVMFTGCTLSCRARSDLEALERNLATTLQEKLAKRGVARSI